MSHNPTSRASCVAPGIVYNGGMAISDEHKTIAIEVLTRLALAGVLIAAVWLSGAG